MTSIERNELQTLKDRFAADRNALALAELYRMNDLQLKQITETCDSIVSSCKETVRNFQTALDLI